MILETAILIGLVVGALYLRRIINQNFDALHEEIETRANDLEADVLYARQENFKQHRHAAKYLGKMIEELCEKQGIQLVAPLTPTAQFTKRVILTECPQDWHIDPETAKAALDEMNAKGEGIFGKRGLGKTMPSSV